MNSELIVAFEADKVLSDDLRDIAELKMELIENDESNDRLIAIVDAIEKHGICRPMMEAVDPDRELVKSGLCCAYEELEDVPTKGEVADGVVDGIEEEVNSRIADIRRRKVIQKAAKERDERDSDKIDDIVSGLRKNSSGSEEEFNSLIDAILNSDLSSSTEAISLDQTKRIHAELSKKVILLREQSKKLANDYHAASDAAEKLESRANKATGDEAEKLHKELAEALKKESAADNSYMDNRHEMNRTKARMEGLEKVIEKMEKPEETNSKQEGMSDDEKILDVEHGKRYGDGGASDSAGKDNKPEPGHPEGPALKAAGNKTLVTIGIGVAIVLAIAGFVRFLFWVIPKLRGLAGSSKNAVTANEAALSSANHALSTIHEFDQEKFRSTAIVTYNKADFNRAVAVNNRVVNEIDHGAMTVLVKQLTATINSGTLTREVVAEIDKKATGMVRGISGNADVKAVLGLDITITNGKISAHSKGTPSIKPTKETAGSHGWNVSDAHTVVNAAIGIAHHNDALAAHIENTTKLCESLGEEMKSFNKSTNVSENEKEAMKSAMASIRGIIDVSLDAITRALETNRSITQSALNVAKAAIAAKK